MNPSTERLRTHSRKVLWLLVITTSVLAVIVTVISLFNYSSYVCDTVSCILWVCTLAVAYQVATDVSDLPESQLDEAPESNPAGQTPTAPKAALDIYQEALMDELRWRVICAAIIGIGVPLSLIGGDSDQDIDTALFGSGLTLVGMALAAYGSTRASKSDHSSGQFERAMVESPWWIVLTAAVCLAAGISTLFSTAIDSWGATLVATIVTGIAVFCCLTIMQGVRRRRFEKAVLAEESHAQTSPIAPALARPAEPKSWPEIVGILSVAALAVNMSALVWHNDPTIILGSILALLDSILIWTIIGRSLRAGMDPESD